ncbi:CLUMA_CG017612, isoform A [Clunio marinus]|uniref:CLUMA_CG017612, isoform A n=1 Tax=Clunio marinus TaxID=568069 RepID=A0A1J1IW86_9DIPT|nr:CLUMA_CG017612, isoform A [Clunio marinus]
MKFILRVGVSLIFVTNALSLFCHHCKTTEQEQCKRARKLGKEECQEPILDDKKTINAKAVCIKVRLNKSEGKEKKLILTMNLNFGYVSRFCGETGYDDSCESVKTHHPNSECYKCFEDFCNGSSKTSITTWLMIFSMLNLSLILTIITLNS